MHLATTWVPSIAFEDSNTSTKVNNVGERWLAWD